MEKTLRVLGGEEGEVGHSHSHSHSPSSSSGDAVAQSTAVSSTIGESSLRSRSGKTEFESNSATNREHVDIAKPSKLSAYLNLFGDFVHNM